MSHKMFTGCVTDIHTDKALGQNQTPVWEYHDFQRHFQRQQSATVNNERYLNRPKVWQHLEGKALKLSYFHYDSDHFQSVGYLNISSVSVASCLINKALRKLAACDTSGKYRTRKYRRNVASVSAQPNTSVVCLLWSELRTKLLQSCIYCSAQFVFTQNEVRSKYASMAWDSPH